MYSETGLLFPYMRNFSPDFHQLDEYCKFHHPNASMGNLSQSSMSEYDLGGEGDLFKAPELIIEEPVMGVDPMTATISMISCGEEVVNPQDLKVDIESIQSEQFLREVLYECERDLMEKAVIESPLSEVLDLDVNIPIAMTNENSMQENNLLTDLVLPKRVSSGCLRSMECVHDAGVKPSFLEFPALDFGNAYGMRRAFSEGDIKTLSNGSISTIHSPLDHLVAVGGSVSEDRKEKLSRYRNKKTKRNFGRKIKYACRKALADSQPRIRGRFAKTEDTDVYKRQ